MFVDQEDIDNHATQNWGEVLPGDIKYKDMNEDGLIDNLDRVKIGSGDVPRITYGVGFNVYWNNFDLGAFFQGTSQADRAVSGFGIMPFSGGAGAGNVYAEAVDRWTEENPNPNAKYPRLAYGSAYQNNTQTSSWWVRDVSFLRLQNRRDRLYAAVQVAVPVHRAEPHTRLPDGCEPAYVQQVRSVGSRAQYRQRFTVSQRAYHYGRH